MVRSAYFYLTRLACLLAFCVVFIGAWVRLTDAGLGCPDWPGCYGEIVVPETQAGIARAEELYPERPVEQGKAWREMIHRYLAGTLGLMILGIVALAWANRRDPAQPVWLPTLLGPLTLFQVLLGMWTVTLLLKPLIVMGHLLGGMAILGCLWWLVLSSRVGGPALRTSPSGWDHKLSGLALLGLLVLIVQIALGGWTSTNYAALACIDFPTCKGQWIPEADYAEGFVLWRGLGVDYEGGVLDHPARVAIHAVHRIGALITFLVLASIAGLSLVRSAVSHTRVAAACVIAALAAQVTLGASLVMKALPLGLAVAHNATAALLLLAVLALNHSARRLRGGVFSRQ